MHLISRRSGGRIRFSTLGTRQRWMVETAGHLAGEKLRQVEYLQRQVPLGSSKSRQDEPQISEADGYHPLALQKKKKGLSNRCIAKPHLQTTKLGHQGLTLDTSNNFSGFITQDPKTFSISEWSVLRSRAALRNSLPRHCHG